MQHVLIIHEVADYDAWKKEFDGAAAGGAICFLNPQRMLMGYPL